MRRRVLVLIASGTAIAGAVVGALLIADGSDTKAPPERVSPDAGTTVSPDVLSERANDQYANEVARVAAELEAENQRVRDLLGERD